MNTSLGYAKRTLTNTNVLLSGGGDKPLSDFIGSISWDSTNRKIDYTTAAGGTGNLPIGFSPLGAGTTVTNLNTLNLNKIYTHADSGVTGHPSGSYYGTLLQLSNQDAPSPGTNGHWISQLEFLHNGALYHRQRINQANWQDWKRIYDSEYHPISYTELSDASSTANLAVVTDGSNGWTLKTLGSNAFNSTSFLSSVHAGQLNVPPTSYKQSVVSAGIAPYISDIGTNIFSGATTDEITVERSTDNGSTWTDVTSTEADNVKNVFSGVLTGTLYVSGNSTGVVGDRIRLTFNPVNRYCTLAFIYVYFSTYGCTCACNVERSTNSARTTWTTLVTDAPIGGWSGPNVIGMGSTYFGLTNKENGYGIRLTFRITAIDSTSYHKRGVLHSIRGYTANKAWNTPTGNSVAKYNVPYTYLNVDRAVQFDNTVKASGFIKVDSSDSYILLGGGGHTALSNFMTLDGTLTSTSTKTFQSDDFGEALIVKRNKSTSSPAIRFSNNTAVQGYIGVANGVPTFWNASVVSNVLIHQGNWSSYVGTSTAPVSSAVNLYGGQAGSVPYLTAAGTTTFINIGTTADLVMTTTNAGSWTLKTLGSRAFDSTSYLPLAAESSYPLTGTLYLSSGMRPVTNESGVLGSTSFRWEYVRSKYFVGDSYIINAYNRVGVLTYTNTLTTAVLTANRTITFPDATGTVALTSHTHDTYVAKAGDTMTGDLLLQTNAGTVIKPSILSFFQSSIPKYLWHDIAAFCRVTTPTYYTSSDGSTWTEATLDKKLFIHKAKNNTVTVLSDTITGSRWFWNSSQFAYSNVQWILIGGTYSSSQCKCDILFETSTDSGSTWTSLGSASEVKIGANPIWFRISGTMGAYNRLTVLRTSTSASGSTLKFCSILLLSYRWGEQGQGGELEYPYDWDTNINLLPALNTSLLGTPSNKWPDLYVTNINGVAVGASPKFTDTWLAANTSQVGYAPKLQLSSTTTIAALNLEYVLTYISGTETAPVWRKLPSNAFSNTWRVASTSQNGVVPATTANTMLYANNSGTPTWGKPIMYTVELSGDLDSSGHPDTTTTVSYGGSLKLRVGHGLVGWIDGGVISIDHDIHHSMGEGTIGTSTASSGKTIYIPYVKYDTYGHIISGGTHTHTISCYTSSDFTLKTASSATHSNWTNNSTDNKIVPTMSFIRYWNGAYNSSGDSALAYCNQGAFGTMATHDAADFLQITGGTMTGTITCPYNTRAINFTGRTGSGIKYDYGSNEALMISARGYDYASILFYAGMGSTKSLNDNLNQWTINDTLANGYMGVPNMQMIGSSVLINTAAKSSYPLSGDYSEALFVSGRGVFSGSSGVDNGIYTTNGTRRAFFGTGDTGNTGLWVQNVGWVVGVDSSGNIFYNGTLPTGGSSNWADINSGTNSKGSFVISNGDFSVTTGNLWVGTLNSTAAERKVGVQSGAGNLYLSSQAATNGSRGLVVGPHGTDTLGRTVISIDTNNAATFNGTANYATSAGSANSATTAGSASYCDYLKPDDTKCKGSSIGSLTYFNSDTHITSSSTDGVANPTHAWYHHITMVRLDADGYFFDMAFTLSETIIPRIKYRARATSSYSSWVEVVTSANISEYANGLSDLSATIYTSASGLGTTSNGKLLILSTSSTGSSIGLNGNLCICTALYANKNGVYFTSDERLKENVTKYTLKLNVLDLENPIKEFTWKDSDGRTIGFIAQEVEKWCPEAVGENEEGYKTVNYNAALSGLCSALYDEVKALRKEIEELKKKK